MTVSKFNFRILNLQEVMFEYDLMVNDDIY